MIIGIDIDGVIVDEDSYRLDFMTKYCFENNLPNIDNPYAYETKCNWTDEILDDYRNKYFYNYIKNATPRNFASEITQKLHEDGNKIIIVTARYKTKEDSIIGQQMREDTRNWLIKNNIYFDEIYFTISPKVSAIQENNIDVMIDDSPEVLPEIVKVTKVFCYDNRYNRDIMLPNMTKVYSWYDIYRKIKEIG